MLRKWILESWLTASIGVCCCYAQAQQASDEKRAAAPAIPQLFIKENLFATIQQLSSNSFELREQASEKLTLQLKQLSTSELNRIDSAALDLEGQIRLKAAVFKIKEERLQASIKGFLRAKNPKDTFGFEGWSTFAKYSGSSRNAKRLFLQLLESHPDLVEKPLASKEEALEKAKEVLTDIAYKRGQLMSYDKTDGLAALYCINASEDLYDPRMERVSIAVFQTSPFSGFSSSPEFKKTIDPMLEKWGVRVKKELLNCLILFLNRESPVSREIAKRVLESDLVKEDPDAYVIAMQAIFRHGTNADIPHVMKWLENEEVCTEYATSTSRFRQNFGGQENVPVPGFGQLPGRFEREPAVPNGLNPIPNQPNQPMQPLPPKIEPEPAFEVWTVEYRDIALLVATQLSGGDVLEDFPLMRTHPLRGFYDQTIGLPKDQKNLRKERIDRWRASKKDATDRKI